MADTKAQTLRELYYDEDGFMSTANLYKDAKRANPSITYADVKEWLAKQSSIQTLTKRTLYNSYVADHKLQVVGCDLADYSRSKEHNDGYAYIFMAIDYFTKFIVAYPLKTKQGVELADALTKTINDLGKMETLTSDTEGGTNTPAFIRVLNQHKIRHIQSSTPVGMIERAIKTIKDLIHKRILGLKLEDERWIDLLPNVVKLYNEKHIHSTTGLTPRQALDPNNKFQVYMNIQSKAKFNMAWPTLRVGDEVRTAIKSSKMTKAHHPKFSTQTYKITNIDVQPDGTRGYFIVSHPNRKAYFRWELRRVESSEDKDT
jgi:hypothetical protein